MPERMIETNKKIRLIEGNKSFLQSQYETIEICYLTLKLVSSIGNHWKFRHFIRLVLRQYVKLRITLVRRYFIFLSIILIGVNLIPCFRC